MTMQEKIFITCAVTGNLTTREHTPHLPVTPAEIAASALDASEAGAAIAHIHVRHPETGKPSMELAYYREVVERIRERNETLILNLTTGLGGRYIPSDEDPSIAALGTTLTVPERRVAHVAALRPEICTLDLNTMVSGSDVVINTPKTIARMAKVIREAGVLPELEVFDSGGIRIAHELIAQGVLDGPGLYSIVMGIRYGFPASPEALLYGRGLLPAGATWTGFGVGRQSYPAAAWSATMGGHVRVGLEDNIYLGRGQLAPSNAALVERARHLVELLGGTVAAAAEARALLGLPATPRPPAA
jgi:uncharacterized protein (DUF849 family)